VLAIWRGDSMTKTLVAGLVIAIPVLVGAGDPSTFGANASMVRPAVDNSAQDSSLFHNVDQQQCGCRDNPYIGPGCRDCGGSCPPGFTCGMVIGGSSGSIVSCGCHQ